MENNWVDLKIGQDLIVFFGNRLDLNKGFKLLILLMQDKKILNEFAAKITKAKILHDNTQATCQKLRREVAQLEKEHATIKSQREAA